MAAARYAALAGRPDRAAVDLAHAAAAVERSSGRGAGQDTLARVLSTIPLEVRGQLQLALQRVLEGRWSARRWLAERTAWPSRMRFAAVAVGAVLVVAGALAVPRLLHSRTRPAPLGAGYLAVRWGDPHAASGGVLALRLDSEFAAESLPRTTLPPGVRQGYDPGDVQPGARTALTACALPNVDPTAICSVDLASGARRPLFRYEGDAGQNGWLPDGAHFLASGGYLSARSGYGYAVLLVDSAGRLARTVARDSFSYSITALSPMGDEILSSRTLGSRHEKVLLRLDGAAQRVAWCEGSSADAWSPDGATIACIRWNDRTLTLAAVGSPEVHVAVPLSAFPSSPPAWSPDSRYIAIALQGPEPGIYVVDLKVLREPLLVWPLNKPAVTIAWVPPGARPRVARVRITPESLAVRVGQRFGLNAYGLDDSGRVVDAPRGIRWRTLDSDVVRLVSGAAGVADRTGTARIVAELGLTKADTARVLVRAAVPRPLLHETFDEGLNRVVWQPFGSPPPRVLRGQGRRGSTGFNNGGDYSRTSGIALRQPLSLTRGLTI